jgi:hypothetical protein
VGIVTSPDFCEPPREIPSRGGSPRIPARCESPSECKVVSGRLLPLPRHRSSPLAAGAPQAEMQSRIRPFPLFPRHRRSHRARAHRCVPLGSPRISGHVGRLRASSGNVVAMPAGLVSANGRQSAASRVTHHNREPAPPDDGSFSYHVGPGRNGNGALRPRRIARSRPWPIRPI